MLTWPLRLRIFPAPQLTGRLVIPARVALAITAAAVIAYAGICYRYADTLSRVDRHPIAKPATYVGATHDDVTFRAADGVTLKGWWFRAETDRQRAVVLVHGKDTGRVDGDLGRVARLFLAHGYSTLLFDLRGHGESEGLRWGLGKGESLDVAAAIDVAAAKAGVPRSRVAVVGFSMGAGSTAMAVGQVPDVGPVVLDSSYADARTEIDEAAPSVSGLPGWFTPGMLLAAQASFGLDVGAVRPSDQVRAHPERAFFFIECDRDTLVLPHHAFDLKAASANSASELWLAQGCAHARAFTTHPADWEQRVLGFIEAQLH